MLSDGRTVEPDDVLGELIPGTKYVHVGDVGRTDSLYDVCRNADALTIEATYLHDDDEMARQFGHMTARRAAQLAADTDVKALLFYPSVAPLLRARHLARSTQHICEQLRRPRSRPFHYHTPWLRTR